MSETPPSDPSLLFESLSALTDGESDDAQVARVLAAWRTDAELRDKWRTYHLTADAMRSDVALAIQSSDEDFLQRFSERLAKEPVVLAPSAMVAVTSHEDRNQSQRWGWGLALAASVVVVMSGVMGLIQGNAPWSAISNESVAFDRSSVTDVAATAPREFPTESRDRRTWPVDAKWMSAIANGMSPDAGQLSVARARHFLAANDQTSQAVNYEVALSEPQPQAFEDASQAPPFGSRSMIMPVGWVQSEP